MKTVIAFALTLLASNAFAEGPILNCRVTREGPRSNGKPGYERIDAKVFNTVIDERIKKTELIGATVKTYVNADGQYVLVLNDHDLETSSTTMGTIDHKQMDLSLSGKGLSNYIICQIQ